MKYLVVIEHGKRNFSAYSPDLPGCIATGRTRAAARARMKAAIRFPLEGLRRHHLPLPKASAAAEVLEVA